MTHLLPPKPNDFSIPVRVYYEDTDAGGVVYYANYLKFFERCRTEWLRATGYQQEDLLLDSGIVFMVRSVNIEYRKPARLDDIVRVSLKVEKISRVQIFFRQHVLRAHPLLENTWEELVSGTIQIVCVNSALLKSTPIPEFLRSRLENLQ
jgi:acyl-CoA thioester hydrolase